MEDESFHIKGIKIINSVLNYIYIGLLVFCLIIALGNRPHASSNAYIVVFAGFTVITAYMTVSPLRTPPFVRWFLILTLNSMNRVPPFISHN